MISVTTPAIAVSLPDRILPNQPLTFIEAAALQSILVRRLRSLALKWLDSGLDASEVQAHLTAMASSYEFRLKPEDGDPLTLEARRIARELIAKRGLDPDGLDHHVEAISNLAAIRARAQEILAARQAAAQQTLGTTP